MKYLLAILFIVATSCKGEQKINSEVDSSVYKMWNSYTKSNPEDKNGTMPESWFFHYNKQDANRLGQLTLNGKKKAASGLYSWYEEAQADLPRVGTKHIITDFDGKALAIIEIEKVDTIPFNQISKQYASWDMGTDIEPLKKWKKAHWDFFANTMEKSEKKPTEMMLVVCEQFKTIWPKQQLN